MTLTEGVNPQTIRASRVWHQELDFDHPIFSDEKGDTGAEYFPVEFKSAAELSAKLKGLDKVIKFLEGNGDELSEFDLSAALGYASAVMGYRKAKQGGQDYLVYREILEESVFAYYEGYRLSEQMIQLNPATERFFATLEPRELPEDRNGGYGPPDPTPDSSQIP